MRVLHACAYFAPAFVYGGPPRSIHSLCRALGECGVHVEVFTTDANGDAALPSEITGAGAYDGVPVTYCPRTWPAEPIGSRPFGRALRAALPSVDLLHIHGLWNRIVWTAAREARRARVPYVLSPRGMLETAALAHRPIRKRVAWTLIERATIDGAAALHATSQREYETLKALRPDAHVVLAPNGVDLPMGLERTGRKPLIAFVGRVHPIKRLDLLVDAFVRLLASGRKAELVIAGPDEASLRSALTARAGRAAASIDWRGPVNVAEKAALFAEAAALVMCSDSESFGLSVAEAMAAAVPVVVTRTCPWAEVEQHRAGFWVEQCADAIVAALAVLLDDPAGARVMGSNGRALIEQKYRWPVVATDLLRHYHRIAAPASRPGRAVLA